MLDIVEKLEQNLEYRENRKFFDDFFSETPCEENGFKGFDYEKLCAMVLFFANKSTAKFSGTGPYGKCAYLKPDIEIPFSL